MHRAYWVFQIRHAWNESFWNITAKQSILSATQAVGLWNPDESRGQYGSENPKSDMFFGCSSRTLVPSSNQRWQRFVCSCRWCCHWISVLGYIKINPGNLWWADMMQSKLWTVISRVGKWQNFGLCKLGSSCSQSNLPSWGILRLPNPKTCFLSKAAKKLQKSANTTPRFSIRKASCWLRLNLSQSRNNSITR